MATVFEVHFSNPVRMAETITKAKEYCCKDHSTCKGCVFHNSPICLAYPKTIKDEDSITSWLESECKS